jgi:hypothetical protein
LVSRKEQETARDPDCTALREYLLGMADEIKAPTRQCIRTRSRIACQSPSGIESAIDEKDAPARAQAAAHQLPKSAEPFAGHVRLAAGRLRQTSAHWQLDLSHSGPGVETIRYTRWRAHGNTQSVGE